MQVEMFWMKPDPEHFHEQHSSLLVIVGFWRMFIFTTNMKRQRENVSLTSQGQNFKTNLTICAFKERMGLTVWYRCLHHLIANNHS